MIPGLNRRLILAAFALAVLLFPGPIRAAGPPVTLEAYWQQVEATRAALIDLEDRPVEERQARLAALADRWAAIDEVILPDGNRAPVDHTFLVSRLRSPAADPAHLEALLASLLEARTAWPQQTFSSGDTAALVQILARPEFDWQPEQPSPLEAWWQEFRQWLWESLARLLFNSGLFILGPNLVRSLFVIGGVIILALVMAFVLRSLWRDLFVQAAAEKEVDATGEALTSDAALKQAQVLSSSGDYRSAVRYLYLSSLLVLEERGLLRYDRFRTNREYLQSVAHLPELAALLRRVIDVFDRVWYGYDPLDQAAYAEYAGWVADLRRQK